jgi:RNA polymerase sigma factor for flagellar operon FliA
MTRSGESGGRSERRGRRRTGNRDSDMLASDTSTLTVQEWQEKRNSIIEECQGYVDTIVTKIVRTMGLPLSLREDFVSAGLLGLVEAADRFNPGRGVDFRTFAFFRIRGAIIDHVRDGCELSGQAYRMFRAFEAAHELQSERLEGRSAAPAPTPSDRVGHAIDYLSKSVVAFKLTGMKGPGDAAAFDQHPPDPEETLSKKRESEKIRRCIATLPEKERTIIEQYYFHDLKMVDVAERYAGLSKSWVSRLHDRALSLLRDGYLKSLASEDTA